MGTENGKCEGCGGPLILIDANENRYECLSCNTETIKVTEDEILAAIFNG